MSERLLTRLRRRLVPDHLFRPLRWELSMLAVRARGVLARRRFSGARGLWVNVGCGERLLPGWVNVDASGALADVIYDCRQGLPFPDGSVTAIFAEHFVEHLRYREELPIFLDECLRALEVGGLLRVVVPDAERYLRAYVEGGWEELEALRGLKPGRVDPWFGQTYRTKMELVNAVFRQAGEHQYAYDFETLERALLRLGFRDVARRRFGESRLEGAAVEWARRAAESLYVEAIKPARRPSPGPQR